jgi:hypothetical protein
VSGTGTLRAGVNLAPLSCRQGPPGLAWGPVHCGGDHRSRTGRLAIPMPVVSWSKGPGPTGIRPKLVGTSNCAWKSSPQQSRPVAERPKSGSVNDIASSWPKAKMPIKSWSPWPGNECLYESHCQAHCCDIPRCTPSPAPP